MSFFFFLGRKYDAAQKKILELGIILGFHRTEQKNFIQVEQIVNSVNQMRERENNTPLCYWRTKGQSMLNDKVLGVC